MRKNQEDITLLLITLYLYSIDINDFDHFISHEDPNGVLMVSLFFDEENAELFNQLAEERFESLR